MTFLKSLKKGFSHLFVRPKISFMFLAVDYRNFGMKLRINVGVEWGKMLSGKAKAHRGYRPMRRVIQVIFQIVT